MLISDLDDDPEDIQRLNDVRSASTAGPDAAPGRRAQRVARRRGVLPASPGRRSPTRRPPRRGLRRATKPSSALPLAARRRDRRDDRSARPAQLWSARLRWGAAREHESARLRPRSPARRGGAPRAARRGRAPLAQRRAERRPGVRTQRRPRDLAARARSSRRTRPAICSASGRTRFRAAEQSFAAVQAAGSGYDNGLSESLTRGELEGELAELGRSGNRSSPPRRQSARHPRLRRRDAIGADRAGPGRRRAWPTSRRRSVSTRRTRREVQPRARAPQAARERRPARSDNSTGGGSTGHRGGGGGIPGSGY